MSARVYRHGQDVYLTGAGATPCLCWRRAGDQWLSCPAKLPDGAQPTAIADLPGDLQEELLAFAARADAMGAAARQLGN